MASCIPGIARFLRLHIVRLRLIVRPRIGD